MFWAFLRVRAQHQAQPSKVLPQHSRKSVKGQRGRGLQV